MIIYDELRLKVRRLINEANDDGDVTLLTVDTRSVDEHIRELMPDAVSFVQRNKGWGQLNPRTAALSDVSLSDNGDGTGSVLLPHDFIALVSFKMTGWQRPCSVLLPADAPLALAQGNVNTRAGWCKPLCCEGIAPDGRRLLNYYSLPSGMQPVVEHFIYEARYNVPQSLSGDDAALHSAVAYRCAALLYDVFERHDLANIFTGIAVSLCNNVELKKE